MDIVVVADAYLDDVWLSRHHLPVELAKRHRVLYVERPPNLIKPSTAGRWGACGRLREGPHGMRVYAPFPRLPFDHRWRWVSQLNQRWLRRQIQAQVKRLGFNDPALLTFDHKASRLMDGWGPGQKVYYCVDDVTQFAWPFARRETVAEDERRTVLVADVTVVTARRLAEKLAPFAKRIETLAHGVRLTWWQDPLKPAQSRPRAVFVGKVAEWVDVGLIGEVARGMPDWDLVMIGPVETRDRLPEAPNLTWRGPVAQSELHQELREGDVGMVPFVINPLTDSVLPLKFYEYLAAGLPVVATPLPELRALEPWVRCVAGSTAFAEALRQAQKSDGPAERAERRAWVKEQTWEARSRRLEAWLCGS